MSDRERITDLKTDLNDCADKFTFYEPPISYDDVRDLVEALVSQDALEDYQYLLDDIEEQLERMDECANEIRRSISELEGRVKIPPEHFDFTVTITGSTRNFAEGETLKDCSARCIDETLDQSSRLSHKGEGSYAGPLQSALGEVLGHMRLGVSESPEPTEDLAA